MPLLDLSHVITADTVTYKGLPAPVICDFLSREEARAFYADGEAFQLARVDFVTNAGTYVDCPSHRFADGDDLADTPLAAFAELPAVCLRHDYVRDGLAFGNFSQRS